MNNQYAGNRAINYANRGSFLEEMLGWANKQYADRKIARVDKVPLPIKILNIIGAVITKAYLEDKSTVDYIGCLNGGKCVCYDAKETQEESFPLKNLKEHQLEYMKQIHNLGGHSFLIISFVKRGKFFRWDYPTVQKYWTNWMNNRGKRGYASVPYENFVAEAQEIKPSNMVALDYLINLVQ